MALDTAFFQQDFLNNLYQGITWDFEDELGFGIPKLQGPDYTYAPEITQSETLISSLTRPHYEAHYETLDADINPDMGSLRNCPRSRRRKPRTRKNKEELESQRMTHIAVERNRRKQMNDYLAVLRSLMPDHCVSRGDQASIVGGAINFVKELEQRLQLYSKSQRGIERSPDSASALPFSEFFNYPQFSTAYPLSSGSQRSTVADIEVTMVESHANLKIRSAKRPKQLLKIVSGLHHLWLTVLHLNVTTMGQYVLYSFSVQVEDDCTLTSMDEIAGVVHQLICEIDQEGGS